MLNQVKPFDQREMIRLKQQAYKDQLDKELMARDKMKQLGNIIVEQTKYETNRQFKINEDNDDK